MKRKKKVDRNCGRDFRRMLRYHEITAAEFHSMSNTKQCQLWWNFEEFGHDST